MTRRASGEGTVYQRNDGRWCAQVSLRASSGTTRKTVYGRTQKEVLAKRAQLQQAAAQGLTVGRLPTLQVYAETWFNRRRAHVELGHLAQSTWNNYDWAWRLYIEPFLGALRLDALTKDVLTNWLLELSRAANTRGTVHSVSSQRIVFATLRAILNDAVDDGLLLRSPLRKGMRPQGETPSARPLSVDESQRFFATAQGTEHYALWVCLHSLGLRIGEALALTWADLDVERATVSVTASVGRRTVAIDPVTGKHTTTLQRQRLKTVASEAKLAAPPVLVELLQQHRRQQLALQLQSRVWQNHDLIFASATGTFCEARNLLREFKALAQRAGIERNVRIHDLRHTTASSLLAEGLPMKVVQATLRHSRHETTANTYAHLLDEVSFAATAAMDARMRRILPPAASGS